VAQSAGLSQAGLLHHFSSKEAILLAVLEDRDHADGRQSAVGHSGTPLLVALESLVAHNETDPDIVRLFSMLLGEGLDRSHPAHDFMVGRYLRIRARIARDLATDMAAGKVGGDVDAETLAAIVVAVMDGLQFQWLLDPTIDMADAFGSFRRILEAGTA
jgi:AcrR family transcriptional regulator